MITGTDPRTVAVHYHWNSCELRFVTGQWKIASCGLLCQKFDRFFITQSSKASGLYNWFCFISVFIAGYFCSLRLCQSCCKCVSHDTNCIVSIGLEGNQPGLSSSPGDHFTDIFSLSLWWKFHGNSICSHLNSYKLITKKKKSAQATTTVWCCNMCRVLYWSGVSVTNAIQW